MPKRIFLLAVSVLVISAVYFIFVFGSAPVFAQATYDTYSQTFGTCPAPDAFNACVTITGSAAAGTAQFSISSRIADRNPDGSLTACPSADYRGSGGASSWTGEIGCDGKIVRTVSGSGDGGTGVFTGAGGLDAGYITWAVPYSGEPNQICYRISWGTVGNSSVADACVTKKAAAAMDVTNLGGPVKVTVGGSATYSADFTWSGDSATWLFDLVNPSNVVVQTTNGLLTASPQTKSAAFNQFTSAGTYKVCASGTASRELAFDATDTQCINVVVNVVAEAPASVDLLADGSNGPISKVVGQSALLDWTSTNVRDTCDSSSTGPATVSGWDGKKWSNKGSTTVGPFGTAGSYTLTLTCFSLASGNPIIKIAHAAVGDAIKDEVKVDVAAASQPDLTVESPSTSPSTPVAGQAVSFSATVKNSGTASAGSSSARLRLDIGNNGSWDVTPANNSTGSLAAGATETETWSSAWTATAGTHLFEVCADVGGTVTESNEGNNCTTKTFTVTVVTNDPVVTADPSYDLLQAVITADATAFANDSAAAHGISLTANDDTRWSFDCTNDGIEDGVRVTPATDTVESFTCTYSASGSYTARVRVDMGSPIDTVKDATVTFKVPATASMSITTPSPSAAAPYLTGQSVIFTSDFTWNGDTGRYRFDAVKDGIVVKTTNWITLSNPPLKTPAKETHSATFAFDVAGTYVVCAGGEATGGRTSFASDTKCTSTFTVNAPSVDIKVAKGDAKIEAIRLDYTDGPLTIKDGDTITLQWTTQHSEGLSGCEAKKDWSGTKPKTGGTETRGPILYRGTPYYFAITCNPGDEVRVDVSPPGDSQPDLAITSYSKPSSTKPGGSYGISGTVGNIGTDTAGASVARLRLTAPSGSVSSQTADTGVLAAAPSLGVTHTWGVSISEEGTYKFDICADSTNVVSESSETNNCVSDSFPSAIPRPNLIIESITITPANPEPGQLVTFTGRVKNIGDARARDSQTRLRIDEDGNGTYDFSPSNLNTSTLDPGQFEDKTWNAVWRAKASNKVIAEIYADVTNLVAESSETDNSKTKEFPVGVAKTLLVSLTASPSSGSAPLNDVDLTAAVSGTAAGAINYTFYCDITKAASATFVGISDNPKTVADLCDYLTAGTYTAKVFVERDGLTAEELATVSVSGEGVPSGPDLTIPGEININPSSPVQGNLLSFSVTVQNIGNETAASSKTRLRLDVGNNGSWDVIPAPIDTGSMPPGSTDFEVWSNIWTASAGTHKVNICADYTKIISESNEINNCKDKTFTVAAPGGSPPDLEILGSLTLSPSSPSAGERVTFSAVASNRGEGPAPDSKTRLLIDVNNDGDAERWDVTADENTGPLNPGESENETWRDAWTAVSGTHRLWACADGPNAITESLETNNCTEKYITVTGPPPPPANNPPSAGPPPPGAPPPSVSSGNACTSSLQPTLSWTFTDPDSGDSQTAYQVQVKRPDRGYGESEVSTGKVNSSSNSYTIPAGSLQFSITYNWRVKVWDQADATSEWANGPNFTTQAHAGPDVDFSWAPVSPLVNETTQFADQTETFGGASIASWLWSFQSGNPASSVIQNPQVKFTSQGTKTITLTVTDSDSIQCSTSKNIEVGLPAPEFREVRP